MMARAHGGTVYSMASDDYIRWRIKLECQRVGCTDRLIVMWSTASETICHGHESYVVQAGPYTSHEATWQGIVGWLDELHTPLVEQQRAYPEAWET